MTRKNVAELLVDVLVEDGVERIYGVAGDSLNGITNTLREREQIRCVGVRREEAAAFAAGAEAHLTGKLAVCAGSAGPGNIHLSAQQGDVPGPGLRGRGRGWRDAYESPSAPDQSRGHRHPHCMDGGQQSGIAPIRS